MRTAVRRVAVEILVRIDGHRIAGAEAVLVAGEVVDHAKPVVRTLPEDDAASVAHAYPARAARDGRPEEVACGIKRHAAVRIFPIRPACECPHRLLGPRALLRGQAVERAAPVEAALNRGDVRAALGIE